MTDGLQKKINDKQVNWINQMLDDPIVGKTCNICGANILINDPIVLQFHEMKCEEWSKE